MGSVASLFGGEVVAPGVPNAGCVAKLKEILERAEAGDVTGIVCVCLHSDRTGSYSVAGMIGPYSMLGAVEMAKADLIDAMRDNFE